MHLHYNYKSIMRSYLSTYYFCQLEILTFFFQRKNKQCIYKLNTIRQFSYYIRSLTKQRS